MTRSLTTVQGPVDPVRSASTTRLAIGLETARSSSGVPMRLRMVREAMAAQLLS
ncbi:MAG TPA: hypothetical protein VN969_42650 [Streptosporangiaceae bacterium]|nr:hypothetical protein [Streptosporangiaceae bacterium]